MTRHVISALGAIALFAAPLSAGTMTIATGADSSVDGHLSIAPDAYGAWASTTFGGGGDLFNPSGANGSLEGTFTSGFFLFVPGLTQRSLLTDNASWQAVVGVDTSLTRTITGGLACSDTTGNLVDDTCTSRFNVAGGSTSLDFGLTQHVGSGGSGVAFMQQDYTVTNIGASEVSFNMVRAYDGDLLWSGDFADDEVGTGFHGSGFSPYVFEQEAGDATTAMVLSSALGENYYGGKMGVDPGGAGLPYGFGTDVQVWEEFGIPANWENHIAGVGYDLNGVSGTAPPGSTSPEDGFIGMDMSLVLGAGEEITFTVFHTYGQDTPIPEPASIGLVALGGLVLLRRRR